jgi:hypothetical protein
MTNRERETLRIPERLLCHWARCGQMNVKLFLACPET